MTCPTHGNPKAITAPIRITSTPNAEAHRFMGTPLKHKFNQNGTGHAARRQPDHNTAPECLHTLAFSGSPPDGIHKNNGISPTYKVGPRTARMRNPGRQYAYMTSFLDTYTSGYLL
jgi:hypothetical protein